MNDGLVNPAPKRRAFLGTPVDRSPSRSMCREFCDPHSTWANALRASRLPTLVDVTDKNFRSSQCGGAVTWSARVETEVSSRARCGLDEGKTKTSSRPRRRSADARRRRPGATPRCCRRTSSDMLSGYVEAPWARESLGR